jgi:hypothetical protein
VTSDVLTRSIDREAQVHRLAPGTELPRRYRDSGLQQPRCLRHMAARLGVAVVGDGADRRSVAASGIVEAHNSATAVSDDPGAYCDRWILLGCVACRSDSKETSTRHVMTAVARPSRGSGLWRPGFQRGLPGATWSVVCVCVVPGGIYPCTGCCEYGESLIVSDSRRQKTSSRRSGTSGTPGRPDTADPRSQIRRLEVVVITAVPLPLCSDAGFARCDI